MAESLPIASGLTLALPSIASHMPRDVATYGDPRGPHEMRNRECILALA